MPLLLDTDEPRGLVIESRVEEGAARAALRRQIAHLERRLAGMTMELWECRGRESRPRGGAGRGSGARLLALGELEVVRDALVTKVREAERVLDRYAQSQARGRARLEAMLAEPPAHRFEVLDRAELGEPGCGAYHVLPRFGLLGMLFGWWCVKLSSGCPLPMPHPQRYYSPKPRSGWGRHSKFELAATIIVVVIVIAAILVFLLVFHDFPFRLGEPS
jgi:hypothetical protein